MQKVPGSNLGGGELFFSPECLNTNCQWHRKVPEKTINIYFSWCLVLSIMNNY